MNKIDNPPAPPREKGTRVSEQVQVSLDGPVMVVTMNRPPANAIDTAFSIALYEAFNAFNRNDNLRAAILIAAENPKRIFCAGWDLKAVARGEAYDEENGFDLGPGGIGGLPENFDLYKPVIAAVNGVAAGGGFELALGADIIVASEDAYFVLPEMQRGFLPDGGAIQKLHRRVPYNVAIDLILTGRRLEAAEAKHWGLVREVVPRERILVHCLEIARNIASGAPLVTKALKEFMRATSHLSVEAAHEVSHHAWTRRSGLQHYERTLQSDDFNEGAAAFSEKRSSVFKGE
jgi:crotonobetainyl-CoA hydratase